MKITSGIYRGRELASPHSEKTHPMGSRERLALFNALAPYLQGATVLDAYAGTGALGLETLSRGAAHATFIEKNHRSATVLRQNIQALNVEDKTTLLELPVEKCPTDAKFDLIFADPPYNDYPQGEILAHLAEQLLPDGRLILSHPTTFDSLKFAQLAQLQLISTKTYASARISTFAR